MLENLTKDRVFYYFEEISNVPRGSYHNQEMSDYLVCFAKEHGLFCTRDKYLNVVIIKEATQGYENYSSVMIQGHMDMVCEKEEGSSHDFTKEGLDLHIDGDFIYANGTTLGGDDGIALAYALAILESEEYKHPRLEVVITTDEEVGMEGAFGLSPENLKSKYLLNLDSEEEGTLFAGCAGGVRAVCSLPVEYSPVTGNKYEIKIKGLRGGHSGTQIHKNCKNAPILLGRILLQLREEISFSVISIHGGQKDNAIPREAVCALVVSEEKKVQFMTKISQLISGIKTECQDAEPNLEILCESGENVEEFSSMTDKDAEKLLTLLNIMPNGVQVMSSALEGHVESSLNLGILAEKDGQISLTYSVRSSVNSYKEYMSQKIKHLITMLGGTCSFRGSYPAWEYKRDSKLRELLCTAYEKQYGEQPKVEAIHAGLECGILSDKMLGIDCVSFGPNMQDIHTPKERLSISSTKRVYQFLLQILEDFCL